MIDPFDHSRCAHPQPEFKVYVTNRIHIDFLKALHVLWKDLTTGDVADALRFIDELGRMLEMSFLGLHEELESEVGRAVSTRDDLQVLSDPQAFDAELRRLFGREQ